MLKLNRVYIANYKQTDKSTTMNHSSSNNRAIADTECSGVFWMRMRETQPYHDAPNYMSCYGDYHLFAKHGDKVYIEVRNAGEIVISFAELQKNKYLKYYYALSLMLSNDTHSLIKNEEFNNTYNQIYGYTWSNAWSKEDREWSLETAYIDQSNYNTYKIIPSGNVCYYKINPADLKNMEYSTPQELDVFNLGYMNGIERVKWFSHRSVIYENLALEYNVKNMEKELDELSEFFENKKIVINLVVIQEKHVMNSDVLMILYNTLLSSEGNKKYSKTIDEIDSCKNKLERVAKIMDV